MAVVIRALASSLALAVLLSGWSGGAGAAPTGAPTPALQSGVLGADYYRALAQWGRPAAGAQQIVPTDPASYYGSLSQRTSPGAAGYAGTPPAAAWPGRAAAARYSPPPGPSPLYLVDGGGLTVYEAGDQRQTLYRGGAARGAPTGGGIPSAPPPPITTPPPEPAPIRTAAPPPVPVGQTAAAPLVAGAAGGISEVRLGVLGHDVALGGGEEGGIDINPEILFASPDFLAAIGAPRPHLGLNVSTSGDTSQFYAGLTWDYFPVDWLFLEGALGGALHDGNLESDSGDSNQYGCAAGFHFQGGAGILVWEHFTLAGVGQYMTNLGLCSENDGLFNAGVRLGYRF